MSWYREENGDCQGVCSTPWERRRGMFVLRTVVWCVKWTECLSTTKCPSWVVPTHALQIQDGGWQPSWKNRKIVISQPRFKRFWWNLARRRNSTFLTVSTVKNLKFRKWMMAAAARLKNRKLTYLLRGLSDFDKIWHSDAVRPSWPFESLQM